MNEILCQGRKIFLKKFLEKDLTLNYLSWLNDPEVVKFSEQRHYKHSLESSKKYYISMEESGHLLMAIYDIKDELHIGNITAYIDEYNKCADIAILVGNKTFWGKGYGGEAFSLTMNLMRDEYNIRKVTAGTMSVNGSMLSIMEKLGMEVECVQKRHFLLDGQEVDLVRVAKFF